MNENLPTRNNNPGDLKDPSTGNFQSFSDPAQGGAALLNDLQSKISGTTSTGLNANSNLVDFSKVYAPESDNNNPGEYAASLANQLGVSPGTTIGSLQPRLGDFAKAVANNEGYDDSSSLNVQSDPKYQAVSGTNQGGLSTWEKYALGAGLLLGGGALATITGGADIPEVAAGEGAIFGGEAAAETGAGAAGTTEAATTASPGLLSKVGSFAKNALIAEGVNQGVNTVKGLFGGGQQPQDNQTSTLNGSTFPDSLNASQQIFKGLQSALTQTATGRVFSQTPDAQSGISANATYGLVPEIVNGNYDSSAARERSQQLVENLSDHVGQVLDTEPEHVSIDEAKTAAIENMKKYTPSNEWAEATDHINNEAETYRQFADKDGNISLGTMERMKKEQYRVAGKWDTTTTSAKKAAHKALGKGARSVIVGHTKNKDLYEKAMKEEEGLINGQKVLKRLDGKKAHQKKSLSRDVLHHLGHYAALAVGDKIGGPFGAIVGELVGSKLSNAIEKRYGKTVWDSPSMKKSLELVGKKNPEVLKLLEHAIEMHSKRKEYKARKEGILNPKGKEKESYEPYANKLPVIRLGRKPKAKEKLPVIRA